MTDFDVLPRDYEPASRPVTADAVIRRAHRRQRRRAALTAAMVTVSVGAGVTATVLRSPHPDQTSEAAQRPPADMRGATPCPKSAPSRAQLMGSPTFPASGRTPLITGTPDQLTVCHYAAAAGGTGRLTATVIYTSSWEDIRTMQGVVNQHGIMPAVPTADCARTDNRPATLALFKSHDGSIQQVLILQGDGCYEFVAPNRLVTAAGSAPAIEPVYVPPTPSVGPVVTTPAP